MCVKLHKETKRFLLRSFLFLIYLAIGMCAFRYFESQNEMEERQMVSIKIERMKRKFNITQEAMEEFVELLQKASSLGYSKGWVERWSYTGSLFFSGTIITTIGYGHLVPVTIGGRLFCMLYALFGIPVSWMMLTSLGKMIVEKISSTLQNLNYSCCPPNSIRFNLCPLLVSLLLGISVMSVIAIVGIFAEQWNFFEGFYFAFISLTTIGFGDYVPQHPNFDPEHEELSSLKISLFVVFCLFLFSFGLAVTTSVLLSIRKIMEDRTLVGFQSLYSSSNEDDEDDESVTR